jgi:hypothetical protein
MVLKENTQSSGILSLITEHVSYCSYLGNNISYEADSYLSDKVW